MLNKLYHKLCGIFVCSIMMVISIIIAINIKHDVAAGRSNTLTYIQRMSTLIVYQLENDIHPFENMIESYAQQCDIFCIVKDAAGETIYQNDIPFPTSREYLQAALSNQVLSISESELTVAETELNQSKFVTEQNGVFLITGETNDLYWGLPAFVVSKDNNIYDLSLFYRIPTAWDIIFRQALNYIFVWILSFMCVILISSLILKQAFKPTEQMLMRQKEFIASASHELKSPLSVLFANVEKLKKCSTIDGELKRPVDVMSNECMRMSRLVNELLLLASCDAHLRQMTKEKIDVDTLLISLYEKYEVVCARKRISLNPNFDKINFPMIVSDSELILQILSIFVDNALSHSENNMMIDIQTSCTAKYIAFCIADHGKGIAEKDKPFIFNRFYCADQSHTDKSHFGLGLSIAAELATILCGKVGFYDTPGGGATFYLRIPMMTSKE